METRKEKRAEDRKHLSHDWVMRTRPIRDVLLQSKILISEGENFLSRQGLELHVWEIYNVLGKRLRYSRVTSDKPGEYGREYPQNLCARAHSGNVDFMIKHS